MSTWDLRRRLKVCILASALNMSCMLLPSIQRPYYLLLLVAILLANVTVCVLVLAGVPPARDQDEYQRLTAMTKKSVIALGYSSLAIVLALLLTNHLHKQVMPFVLCGWAFFPVIMRVLDVSLHKRLGELEQDLDRGREA